MKLTHTAGPWSFDSNDDQIYGSNGMTVGTVYNSDYFLCFNNEEENENDKKNFDEECLANSRLIAAAPELLEACKALQSEAKARNCGLRIADEAIEKAEGK